VKDIEKSQLNPHASKDAKGRLLVGSAIGVGIEAINRAERLVDSGVDVLVIDTAHGHSEKVISTLEEIKSHFSIDVVVGNVATKEATAELIDKGADCIKVGIGPGSICTTRVVAGIGVPQFSAILDCAEIANKKNIPVIADGGIKYSGDIAKALGAGANAVMIGSLFAGTNETPGKLIKKNGKLFKSFRGMGSVGAMNKGSADRYFQKKQKDISKYVPEGVEGFVKYKGNVGSIIYKLVGGLKSSMGYLGSKNIFGLRNKPHFVKITKAGFYESMVHNVDVIKNDSKY
jgi:IMP dehydrogenase